MSLEKNIKYVIVLKTDFLFILKPYFYVEKVIIKSFKITNVLSENSFKLFKKNNLFFMIPNSVKAAFVLGLNFGKFSW